MYKKLVYKKLLYKKRKRLSTALWIYISVFVIGAIYASASGNLNLSGYANLSSSVNLTIVNAVSPDGVYPDKNGTITVSEDGQSAEITANLTAPGEYLDYTFAIRNTGSSSAVIERVYAEHDPDSPILISGNYLDLMDCTVNVGEETNDIYIRVAWNSAAAAAAGSYTFSVTIPYVKAP